MEVDIQMVYLMINSYYPGHKLKEVGDKYIRVRNESELKPSHAKRIVPVGVYSTTNGFRVTAIYDVKPGQLEESIRILTKSMLILTEIEGYTYTMEVLLSGTEAMPMIGMKMPE
ncbi:MAG: hypothetical protein BAJALOKI2v1_1110005 [Promethearchaeota archaeon]|nr:MAG: hypothetical protein BAJALOKI2v1_1110005 [Candidatus Lokiarchaeota archaeon]